MVKSRSSREIIRKLEAAGWNLVRATGSHHHYRHDARPGTVTVPHPVKDMPIGTLGHDPIKSNRITP